MCLLMFGDPCFRYDGVMRWRRIDLVAGKGEAGDSAGKRFRRLIESLWVILLEGLSVSEVNKAGFHGAWSRNTKKTERDLQTFWGVL